MSIKAISLISGGLDSTLATKVVMGQGVEVIAANFVSPFFRCGRGVSQANPKAGDRRESRAVCGERPALSELVVSEVPILPKDGVEPLVVSGVEPVEGSRTESRGCRHEAEFVSEQLGIPLKIVDVTRDFLEVLKSPKHGYGSNINPCIDCRILMLKKAKELMGELGASFLITGEVLGQRPMSQRRDAMNIIEREAGVKGLVLRPLSAKLLESTIPETKGWVDRDKLLAISGRGRKTQIQMAQGYNIKDYPCPAGGCLLTDPAFSRRIRDLIDHDELTFEDVRLLNHGRYFRFSEKAKLVVGKNRHENEKLESLADNADYVFYPARDEAGASGLGRGDFSQDDMVRLAARVTARYFDAAKTSKEISVGVRHGGSTRTVVVAPFSDEETKKYLI